MQGQLPSHLLQAAFPLLLLLLGKCPSPALQQPGPDHAGLRAPVPGSVPAPPRPCRGASGLELVLETDERVKDGRWSGGQSSSWERERPSWGGQGPTAALRAPSSPAPTAPLGPKTRRDWRQRGRRAPAGPRVATGWLSGARPNPRGPSLPPPLLFPAAAEAGGCAFSLPWQPSAATVAPATVGGLPSALAGAPAVTQTTATRSAPPSALPPSLRPLSPDPPPP